jgi:hypothetical protein
LADHEFQKKRSLLEKHSLARPKLLQEVKRNNEMPPSGLAKERIVAVANRRGKGERAVALG